MEGLVEGNIDEYDPKTGVGFIKDSAEGRRHFFHHSDVKATGHALVALPLPVGREVLFRPVEQDARSVSQKKHPFVAVDICRKDGKSFGTETELRPSSDDIVNELRHQQGTSSGVNYCDYPILGKGEGTVEGQTGCGKKPGGKGKKKPVKIVDEDLFGGDDDEVTASESAPSTKSDTPCEFDLFDTVEAPQTPPKSSGKYDLFGDLGVMPSGSGGASEGFTYRFVSRCERTDGFLVLRDRAGKEYVALKADVCMTGKKKYMVLPRNTEVRFVTVEGEGSGLQPKGGGRGKDSAIPPGWESRQRVWEVQSKSGQGLFNAQMCDSEREKKGRAKESAAPALNWGKRRPLPGSGNR